MSIVSALIHRADPDDEVPNLAAYGTPPATTRRPRRAPYGTPGYREPVTRAVLDELRADGRPPRPYDEHVLRRNLPLCPVPVISIERNLAAIRAYAEQLADPHAVQMLLAPIAAQLADDERGPAVAR